MSDIQTNELIDDTLCKLGETKTDLVLVNGTEDWKPADCLPKFLAKFPTRLIECAEDQLIEIGIGLSRSGLNPLLVGPRNLATSQFETIRSLLNEGNPKLRLISVDLNGSQSTKFDWNDFSFLRPLNNLVILEPGDSTTARAAISFAADHSGSVYLRFRQANLPLLYNSAEVFRYGRGILLKEGEKIALIAAGSALMEALHASEELADLNPWVVDMHTIKPIDRALLKTLAFSCRLIVTAEDHNALGGIGSTVAELLSEQGFSGKLIRLGTGAGGSISNYPSAMEIVKQVRAAS